MLSNTLDKISFYSLFLTIVLLPIFVLPGSLIPVGTSKGLLLVLGLTVSFVFYIAGRIRMGKIEIPKSKILLAGFLIVLATLISALFSSSSGMSFFGIVFDIGSFWFLFASFLLMLMTALVIKEEGQVRSLLLGVLISLSVAFLFQILRFFNPELFSLGILGAKTDNLIGSWNSLGLMAGFTIILATCLIEFFQLSKTLKWLMGSLVALSLFLMAAVNFVLAWKLLGIFALVLFVYKISVSTTSEEENQERKNFPFLAFFLVLFSLLFLISRGFLGNFLPNTLSIEQVEIRPSFSGTLTVGGGLLSENPLFGSGPNKWSDAWASHKPETINRSGFWDTAFNSGSGLIPTFALVGGIVTILAWIFFIFSILFIQLKVLLGKIQKKINFESAIFLLGAVYLMVVTFFYTASEVSIFFMFIFLGIFIGLSNKSEEKFWSMNFYGGHKRSFLITLIMILLILASTGIGFKYLERFASLFYFSRTFRAETIEQAEQNIVQALALNRNDLYLRTFVQVYFTKLNLLTNRETPATEEELGALQSGFTNSVNAANLAINWNKDNYQNYQILGSLYFTAGNSGASEFYDQAIEQYSEALKLNPLNPRLKLEIGRIYFVKEDYDKARELLTESLTLKPDYIDGLIVMSQIEVADGSKQEAIRYAEQALALAPDNEVLQNYLNSLQGKGPVPVLDTIEENTLPIEEESSEPTTIPTEN